MSWVIWGAIILNLLGYFMDATWTKYSDKPGYFSYNIGLLSNFPYWLFATLTFFAANGFEHLSSEVVYCVCWVLSVILPGLFFRCQPEKEIIREDFPYRTSNY